MNTNTPVGRWPKQRYVRCLQDGVLKGKRCGLRLVSHNASPLSVPIIFITSCVNILSCSKKKKKGMQASAVLYVPFFLKGIATRNSEATKRPQWSSYVSSDTLSTASAADTDVAATLQQCTMSTPGCCCFFSQVGVWQTEEGRERMWCPKPFYIACWHRCSICAQDRMTEQSARCSFVAKLHRMWHCSLIRHPETNTEDRSHK